MQAGMHARCAHRHTLSRVSHCTRTHMQRDTHSHTHAHTHMHMQCRCTHTHAHTRAQCRCTHTHARARTHAPLLEHDLVGGDTQLKRARLQGVCAHRRALGLVAVE